MEQSIPLAFVESGNFFYHIYVTRLESQQLMCQVRLQIPNDYTGTSIAKLFPTSEEPVYECLYSANHYHELKVVDAVVELCFGQFMSSPSLDGTGTCFNEKWCFYSPSRRYIQQIRAETGNTYYTDCSFEKERDRYPDLEIIPLAVAEAHRFDWLSEI